MIQTTLLQAHLCLYWLDGELSHLLTYNQVINSTFNITIYKLQALDWSKKLPFFMFKNPSEILNPFMHNASKCSDTFKKNFAAFAARFLKCAWPFWSNIYERLT